MAYYRRRFRRRFGYGARRFGYGARSSFSGQGKYTLGQDPKKYYKKKYKSKAKSCQQQVKQPKSAWKYIAPVLGTLGGSLIGAMTGGVPGAVAGAGIGGTAASGLASMAGYGAYKLQTNSIIGVGSSDPPMMHGSGNGVRIRHREFIKDIVSHGTANTFKVESMAMNPNINSGFPWLANIAQNFQEWVPLGIVYEYKSTSSDSLNSTNTALGQVIMATQYNSNQAPFKRKSDMENTEYTVSCKPSISAMHAVECDPSMMVMPRLYVQKPTTSVNDLRFQNLGIFSIATDGFQGTSVKCGELWVTYDILLCFPIQDSSSTLLGDHYQIGTGATTSAYFGTVIPTVKTSSNFGTSLTNTTIVLPNTFAGNVKVDYFLYGASTAWTVPTMTGSNGVTVLNLYSSDSINYPAVASETGTTLFASQTFAVSPLNDGSSPTITFSAGTLVGTQTGGDLFITTIQNFN